jgi:hypothetical protein
LPYHGGTVAPDSPLGFPSVSFKGILLSKALFLKVMSTLKTYFAFFKVMSKLKIYFNIF